ncbi:MAG: hypothetical protein KME19_21005 [Microcoleus vaginatus WJT46-NPBG5]|nr:hypothetical protein [Microcoleus vaginatus WJT46-NPBG5]
MIFSRLHRILAPLLLCVLLLVTACTEAKAPSRWDAAQQTSTQKQRPQQPKDGAVPGQPVAGKPVTGGNFNKFFPKGSAGYSTVPAQEKTGFAEYKLNQGGKNVAMLSINDLANNPTAAQKFQQPSKTIAGYPAVNQGNNITALLVGGRYQVKVQSRDPSFTPQDREAWLQKFNLSGLSRLK